MDSASVVGLPAQLEVPSSLAAVDGPVAAVASFLLVLVGSVALLTVRERAVVRAVKRTLDGSPTAVLYGLVAFGLVLVVGAYVVSQVGQLGRAGLPLAVVVGVVAGGAVLVLSAFGYLVVGTALTQIVSSRDPWVGAVLGSGLSAVPWLVLPLVPALGVWVLVAAAGVGASARHYIHGERPAGRRLRG
jgi:hypothetical protein